MSTKHLAVAGIAAAVALSLAACGSSSSSSKGGGSSDSSSATNTASPSATPPTPTPLTKAALGKVVLQPTDLPAGWKGTPNTDDTTDSSGGELAKCVGAKNTDVDEVALVHSDDFDLGKSEISSEAESYKAQADIDSDRAVLSNPKLVTCFESELKKEAASGEDGVTLVSVTAKFVPPATGAPKGYLGHIVGQAVVAAKGAKTTVYLDGYFLSAGLTEADVDAFSATTPVDPTVMMSLIQKVSARLTA